MKNIDEFLELLKDYEPQKNGSYKARCPAHMDGSQKKDWHLNVRQKENKIQIKCWKRCSTEDILKALGLQIRDLYLDNKDKSASPGKMPDPFSLEAPELLQHHVDLLLSSAISLDIIKERGYKSIDASDLGALGYSKTQQGLGWGILIPLHGVDGKIVNYQFRPDHPREDIKEDGTARKRKYEMPYKSANRLDVLPRCLQYLGEPQIPLIYTEGTRKGDAIVTAAEKIGIKVCVIVLTGVWNFRGVNSAGGKTLIPDFQFIALNAGRKNYFAFDSDAATNPHVSQARKEIAGITKNKGSVNYYIILPDMENGAKMGADDYLALGHGFNDLMALAQEPDKGKITLNDPFKSMFAVVDGRIGYYKSDQDGSFFTPVGDFSAQIAEVIIKDDGRDQKKYYRIIGKDSRGIMLPDVIIPVSEYESLDWVNNFWDVRAVISPERKAKAQIAATLRYNAYEAKRKMFYSHTGWIEIQGKHIYLSNGSAIGMPDIGVDLDDDLLTGYSLPQPVDNFSEALQASLRFLTLGNPDVLFPLWASMFMAPLNGFVLTDFSLYLEGGTGSYKSGISALALNHYGVKFTFNDFPGSWLSTENRLEHQMFTCKDAVFVVDDLAPGINDKKKAENAEKADRIIREQANRSGRGRMASDVSNRKTFYSRCFLVTSGEYLPSVHSATARTFVVPVMMGDIDRKKFIDTQDEKHLYSQAMTQYLLWISRNWNQLKIDLPKQIRQWTSQALELNNEQHARLPAAVGMLYAGLTTALSFFVESKAIDEVKARELMKQGWDIFIKLSAEQARGMDSRRPARQLIEALITLKDQGRVVFWSAEDKEPQKAIPGVSAIGWYDFEGDKKIYYLNPGAAFMAAVQFCANKAQPITVNEDAVWRELLSIGYSEGSTEIRDGKTVTRSKYAKEIYKEKKWLIRLKKDVF